jgi:hypothetical protein
MVTFTIRPSVAVGDPVEKTVTAPAYLLSAEQAISLGHRLIEAGRELQNEMQERARAARGGN